LKKPSERLHRKQTTLVKERWNFGPILLLTELRLRKNGR
jgi:hypothetical protein